jgi:sarcosine oxidase subunit alpha
MQVACAHRLARTYGLLAGESAVFSIGDDLGLEAAIDLSDLGLKLLCVADTRQQGQDPNLVSKLEKRNILFLRGWTAFTAKGNKGLKGVTLGTKTGDRHRRFSCDILVASAGLTPVIGPLTMVQAKLQYDNHTGFFVPVKTPEKIHPAGRVLGLQHPLSVEASGRLAGLRAAADCEAPAEADLKYAEEALESLPGPARGARPIFPTRARQKVFICFDEDTTLKHIDQAMKLGFDVPELIKRFTAAGTGPGQGGIPGHNLPLYVRYVAGSPDNDPKPTTIRSPLVPTFLGTYAGSNCDISKRTPVHEPQMAGAGGKIERVGVWYRVRYFSEDKSARAEIENVRNNVGMLDSSTLGKFRIYGPDALQALQRVYVGNMSDLKEEKVKYSAMCNEDGCIKDDGVVVKRGENDYYFTTSTGRAGVTSEWIRYHTRYDGWDFHIVNLTDGFGAINLTGPNAREVLGKVTSTDLSNEGFPFTGYREFLIQDKIPVRAMRLGFLGELSYELHVPASYMPSLWELLEEAGREFNLRNFGLEAQNALRLEKGHIIIGSESEPRTTLHDLGLGFLWYRDKPEAKTVGAFALKQTESQEGRLKLVGFKLKDDGARAPKDGSPIVDDKIRGYVCTARYSYSLKEVIGMALVEDSLSTVGTRLAVFEDDCKGGLLYAMVVSMPFYDPAGKRMRI